MSTVGIWLSRSLEPPEYLEKFGIDYCCGGKRTLDEACRSSNLAFDDLLHQLELSEQNAARDQSGPDWSVESLTDFARYPLSINTTSSRAMSLAALRSFWPGSAVCTAQDTLNYWRLKVCFQAEGRI
ncbi:MAG: DUF542 domain-containing protein [Acidobacteria bacterium]|nr:DUF542 domain-containing protein [Acidobacteriota bacterium]